jgi:hypothetical protein
MADTAQIAAALASIAQVLQALQQQNQPHVGVLQHYDAATPFDLGSRAGSSAFDKACSPISDKWDGSIAKLPSFIISMQTHASECKWNAPDPNGIITYTVNGVVRNILTEYHSIPMQVIEAARAARIDDRAIQNARAFYYCLKESLEGDIRQTVFAQPLNHPAFEDGASLFKTITGLSMASSLQLTIQTVQDIQALEPADFQYKIALLNTRLTHLFMLAASVNRQMSEEEKLQHTLTIYCKIKQPEAWAQWVRNKIEAFDENQLLSCQELMNSASLKQLKIASETGDFRGRSTTIHEDVVAMLAAKSKRTPTAAHPLREPKKDLPGGKAGGNSLPPFVRHFKAGTAAGGAKYSLGDTKTFEGTTWYFCGCPKHRDGIKWHTHAPDTCRVRQKWLASPEYDRSTPASANLGTTADDLVPDGTSTEVSSLTGNDMDVTALLAHALSAVGDNAIVKDLIADALGVLHDA